MQISEVCTQVGKVQTGGVCKYQKYANTANVAIAKAQMYDLKLGNGTIWSNTRSGGSGRGDIAKVVGKSNVVLFSSPARFQGNSLLHPFL